MDTISTMYFLVPIVILLLNQLYKENK